MIEPRIKAGIWVGVALRKGNADGRYGAVIRKGDPDAGGVLVVLRNDKQVSVLSQARSGEGELACSAKGKSKFLQIYMALFTRPWTAQTVGKSSSPEN